jgi:ornithine cyclodeaminase/alanine dehydrogenase-like protein (mu-crystallin family)
MAESCGEGDAEKVQRTKVIIDSRQTSLAEAGNLVIPIKQGVITDEYIHAEIGEIVAGLKPGRESDNEITYFKSVGAAAQDIPAARSVLNRATEYRNPKMTVQDDKAKSGFGIFELIIFDIVFRISCFRF